MNAYQLGNAGLPASWNDQKTFVAVMVFMCYATLDIGLVLPTLDHLLPGLPALSFFYYVLISACGACFAVFHIRWIIKRTHWNYQRKFNRAILLLNKHGGESAQKAIDLINSNREKRRKLIEMEDVQLRVLALKVSGIELNIKYNGFEDVVV